MIEIWSLAAMDSRISKRFKSRQRLAGEPADLYRLSLMTRFYHKRAEADHEGKAEQKARK